MARKNFVAGNWKMNTTPTEGAKLARELVPMVEGIDNVEIAVCVPFTNIAAVGEVVKGTNVKLGAQNFHVVEKEGTIVTSGAYTGEVSPTMLKDAGVEVIILGHSERRQYFGETDASVNLKLRAAFETGLEPIVCVGETLEEREAAKTESVIDTQVRGCFANIPPDQAKQVTIAYEPVWAIGTGKTATPEMAQEVHAQIRALLTELYDADTADAVRIQYGGSMKPGNAVELIGQKDIDGGLIGGAALKAADFTDIIKAGQ